MPPIATIGNPPDRRTAAGTKPSRPARSPYPSSASEHRSDSNVADRLAQRLLICARMRRVARRSHRCPAVAGQRHWRQIVLSHMHACRTRHQSKVGAVVDDHHGAPKLSASATTLVTQFEEPIGARVLRTQSGCTCAPPSRYARATSSGPPASRAETIDVDDGVERGKETQAVSARLLFFGCGMNRSMKDVLSRPA